MPATNQLPVKSLQLDLKNFRIVAQKNELGAVRALIASNPDWFWALAQSVIDDGYHITENILVMERAKGDYVVKEGNRRIAVLKICLGLIRRPGLDCPDSVAENISNLTAEWKKANQLVPCAVYQLKEAAAVDRIVTLTHGKGEKAGRANWNSVARARHARDENGTSEPALDLLERYLKDGMNLTSSQKERWGGLYPLTVLDEALKSLAPRLSVDSVKSLVDLYPKKITHKAAIEKILQEIGLEKLGYPALRDKSDDILLTKYGIPAISPPKTSTSGTVKKSTAAGGPAAPAATPAAPTPRKLKAVAIDDARAVMRQLREFQPIGKNREKVVTLLEEARRLKLKDNPIAFCFLLRSMFEISAKAYCKDHAKTVGAPSATKANGDERKLVDILRDITNHLTNNNLDKTMAKALHGAMAEMAKHEGFLSVTSMNQLVHSPKFSVTDSHISVLFSNIFPLLEAMNA